MKTPQGMSQNGREYLKSGYFCRAGLLVGMSGYIVSIRILQLLQDEESVHKS